MTYCWSVCGASYCHGLKGIAMNLSRHDPQKHEIVHYIFVCLFFVSLSVYFTENSGYKGDSSRSLASTFECYASLTSLYHLVKHQHHQTLSASILQNFMCLVLKHKLYIFSIFD